MWGLVVRVLDEQRERGIDKLLIGRVRSTEEDLTLRVAVINFLASQRLDDLTRTNTESGRQYFDPSLIAVPHVGDLTARRAVECTV